MFDIAGQLALGMVAFLLVVFLVGSVISVLLIWVFLLRRNNTASQKDKYQTLVLGAIVGGVLAVIAFVGWEWTGKLYSLERVEFKEQMQKDYALKSVRKNGKKVAINYHVPRDGDFNLRIYGVVSDNPDKTYPFELEKVIIEQVSFKETLNSGSHAVVFDLDKYAIPEGAKSLDFMMVIDPVKSEKVLINDRMGLLVANPGEVDLEEGVNYSSDKLFYGYIGGRRLPYILDSRLHIVLD